MATPGPMLRDFESYYAAGATWLAHGDPYSTAIWPTEALVPGVVAARYELLPYVGPPMSLPLWALFSRLSFQNAAGLWAGITILAALTVASATARLVRRRDRWSMISLLLMAISFGPLTSDLALGQVAIVAFAAALVTTLLVGSQRCRAGTATAVVAALQPNVALLLFAAVRDRRAIVALGTGLAIFFTFCLHASGGVRGFLHYFSVLNDHLGAERYALIQVTPTAIAYGFGLGRHVASATGNTVAAAAILLGLYCITSRAYQWTAKLALLCAVLPFAEPFFHEHDLIVAFFPAVACVVWFKGRLRAVAAFAGVLVAVDWLGIAQRPDGTFQASLLALSMTCALAIMPLRQTQGDNLNAEHDNVDARADSAMRMQLLPLLLIPLIVVCGLLAGRDPAPVWPDAMRALPSSVHNLSAAAAWHLELARSGLMQVKPFWALLRSLSLLGCGLLVLICATAGRTRSAA